MKIAKYILLLLALFSIAFSVFVATQPGSFEIVKEKNIDTGARTIEPDIIKQSESKIEDDSEVQKKRTDEQEVEEEPEEKDQLKAEEPVKK
jgi:hypothetical protein